MNMEQHGEQFIPKAELSPRESQLIRIDTFLASSCVGDERNGLSPSIDFELVPTLQAYARMDEATRQTRAESIVSEISDPIEQDTIRKTLVVIDDMLK